MSRRELLILTLAFLVSVGVRWPQLNRPLSAHHEFCTAFTLIAISNWQDGGYVAHHGIPSGGFIREGERLFPPERFDARTRATALYYFSYPPFAYDLAYAWCAWLKGPSVIALQTLNLLLELLAVLAFYMIVRWAGPERDARVALSAATLYLFLPTTLWFHGNVYVSDVVVQDFWLFQALCVLAVMTRQGSWYGWIIGTFITTFLAVGMSWLGLFAAVSSAIVLFAQWRRQRRPEVLMAIAVIGLGAAMALVHTYWRYTRVIDHEGLLQHFGARWTVRGSTDLGKDMGRLLVQLISNYRTSFLPLFILIAMMLLTGAFRAWRAEWRGWGPVFGLLGVPVVLDHAALLRYAEHDFSALKAAPLLCLIVAIALGRWRPAWSRWSLGTVALAGVLYYYRVNPMPGWDGGRNGVERGLGLMIAREASPDEVIFGIGVSTEPQVVWYAKRNIIGVGNEEQARAILMDRGLPRGMLVRPATNGGFEVTHITSPAHFGS